MSLHLDRLDAVEPQPWRNRGGETRELLAWPRADDWQLRLSVADIRVDGPFSPWPGVERWFAVVDGAGVVLALPDGPLRVEADGPPVRFAGEAAPMCELLDGETRDLNLMLRRGSGHGEMERAEVERPFATPGRLRALFAADALTLQVHATDALRLPPMSLAWADGGAHGVWRIAADAPVRAWWIHFEPAA